MKIRIAFLGLLLGAAAFAASTNVPLTAALGQNPVPTCSPDDPKCVK